MADVSFGVGILCTLLAAFFYGIQYVPCKQYTTFDGAVFQWFMCSGILWGGIVLQLILMLAFDWPGPQVILYGVLSGMLWGSANFLVIPLVRICGLALGFSLYHIINLSWGYCLSRFGLFGMDQDVGRIPVLRDVGVFVLLASFVMLFWVEPEEAKATTAPLKTKERPSQSVRHKATAPTQSDETSPMGQENDDDVEVVKSPTAGQPSRKYLFGLSRVHAIKLAGIALAIAAGVLTAMNGWPYALWAQTQQGKDMMAVQFVFSQTIGIYAVSSIWYWLSSTIRQFAFKKRTNHSVIRPAFIAGLFWVIGDVNMLYGIDGIGYAAAYTLDAVGPVMVASVLSLLWFKEIKETRQRLWFTGSFVTQVAVLGAIVSSVVSRLSAALARLLARLRQNSGDQWIGNRIVKEVLLENGTDLLIRVMKRFPDLAELAGECIAAATSENVICGSGAPTTVTFGTPPHDVQFHMQTADYYGAGLGYKIWPAAIALARAIYQHDVSLGDHPKVVEIGAGVGLAGIAAAKFGEASSVCFTDRMAGSLEVAMRNAKRNCLSGRFSSKVVDWRDADGLPDDADVMLGADVIYEEAHAELIMQLLRNFHGKKAVLALMPQRPGYREFISKLRNLKSVQVAKMSVSTPIGECSILEISVID